MARMVTFEAEPDSFDETYMDRFKCIDTKQARRVLHQQEKCRARLTFHFDKKSRCLVGIQLCKNRWCNFCDVGRSMRFTRKLNDKLATDEAGSQYLMLTVNAASAPTDDIWAIHKKASALYRSLRKQRAWKRYVKAYFRKLDVGVEPDKVPRPHFHILVKLKAGVDRQAVIDELKAAFDDVLNACGSGGDLTVTEYATEEHFTNATEYICGTWLSFNQTHGLGLAVKQMSDAQIQDLLVFMNGTHVHDFGGQWRGKAATDADTSQRETSVEAPCPFQTEADVYQYAARMVTRETNVEKVQEALYFFTALHRRAQWCRSKRLVNRLACYGRALSHRYIELTNRAAGIVVWNSTMTDPRKVRFVQQAS